MGPTLFSKNAILARRTRTQNLWNPILKSGEVVIVLCGEPLKKPGGLDQTYPFIPHPDYYWLTGQRRHEGAVLYSKDHGWIDFTLPLTRAEKIWEGTTSTSAEPNEQSHSIHDLPEWINKHKPTHVHTVGQPSTPIKTALHMARRQKDAEEIALIKKLAAISNEGYKRIKSVLKPGISERELQIEYEAAIYKAGAERTPYDTIVGAGSNAAILHAIPTQKIIQEDELVLIDAGADIADYCVDITRVLPASGTFTARAKSIYELVKAAQTAGLKECTIGTPWNKVHRASARVIAEGLKSLKLMHGDTDDILDTGAISVFYPHGVGHLVGLRVRDTGHEENLNPKQYCGATLRVDLPLGENYLVTVEPGCYFIQALINDTETRNKFKDFVNFQEAERWLDLGGVRLEDDILITKSGPESLTSCVEK